MTDDLKTGTTDGTTGTDAQASGGSVNDSAGGSAGGESIEELRRRLIESEQATREAERKNAQLLSEKSSVEQARREAEARLASAGTVSTPPTGSQSDPYAQQIATTMALANYYPENTYEGQQARATLVSLQGSQALWRDQQRNQALNVELMMIEDKKRPQVIQKLKSGQYNTVQAALEAVEGKDDSEAVRALRKEIEDLKRTLASDKSPVADVSVSTRGGGSDTTGKRKVGMSEWTRVQSAGGPAAVALEKDYYSGKIELDPDK